MRSPATRSSTKKIGRSLAALARELVGLRGCRSSRTRTATVWWLQGMVSTFSASLPVHFHVSRPPSTKEEQVAALVATGIISTSTIWRTAGAVLFNSQVVFRAQAELHAAYAAALAKEGAVRS